MTHISRTQKRYLVEKTELARKRKQQYGLTLIELLVVTVIVAVLAGLAVPSFQDQMRQQRVEGAAEGLVAALQNAKAEAVTSNATLGVGKSIVFTSSGSVCTGTACANASNAYSDWCYGITKAGDTTCDCTTAGSCATGSVVSNTDYTGIGVTFNTAKSRTFESLRGTATSGTIRFFAAGGKSLGVTTTSTGRIRICKDSASTLTSYIDSGACP